MRTTDDGYHLTNVISLSLSQSDHIQQLPLLSKWILDTFKILSSNFKLNNKMLVFANNDVLQEKLRYHLSFLGILNYNSNQNTLLNLSLLYV